MTRYRYNAQSQPPAPYVHASIRCAETGESTELAPAQVDTGADTTVVPAAIVATLGLNPMESREVTVAGGASTEAQVYLVDVILRDSAPITTRALCLEGEPYVLLGRDVLNHFRITLDGPNLLMDVE